ncbi:MAG TPA: TonB-dependent receptor plug domain-containing protein [Longimicrobiaceae bacterium]|jgi:hypothetical protein
MTMIRWLLGAWVAGAAAPCAAAAQAPAPRPDTLPPSPVATPAAEAPARAPLWAGAARTVLSGEELRRSGETHLLAALAGRVPGLEVLRGGGEAGSAVAARIRGARAWAGGGPLLVVDGVPVAGEASSTWAGTANPLAGVVGSDRAADLDLDEVESVEVLRGPAAAARFGARGAGGALLVATRRGRAGRTEYTLRSAAGAERPAGRVPLQRRYGMGTQGISTACGAPNCAVLQEGVSWGPLLPEGSPTFDHAAELFETGRRWDNSLAVSGGNSRGTFFLSGGVLAQDGYFAGGGDGYDRRTLRLGGTHRPRGDLELSASAALASSAGRYAPRASTPSDLLMAGLRTPPEFDSREFLTPEGLHRSFRFPNPRPGAELASRGTDNPFYLLEEGEYAQDVSRALGSFTALWKPRRWLRVGWTLGADRVADDRLEARPLQSSGAPAGGTVGSWRLEDARVEHSLAVDADWALGSALSGTLGAGHELGLRDLRNVRVVRSGRSSPLPLLDRTPGAGAVTYDDRVRRTLDGYSLRGTLDVAGQLFLAGVLRSDGVAVAGEERHRAWYPAAGATWSFARTLGIPAWVAGGGDLRLAYGRSGQEAEPYLLQDLLLFAPAPRFVGPGVTPVSRADFRGASGPEPAVTDEVEAGMDLGLLGGRAQLGATWFRADTRRAALFLPRATPSGVRAESVGDFRDAGWEAALRARPYTGRRVAVELGLNWARARNRVVGLGGADVLPYPFEPASFAGSRSVAQVGLPLGVVRGFDFARCGRGLTVVRAGAITHDVGAACRGAPDGALFVGADGFPVRDPNERVIADPTPDWTGALAAELRVLGVRLGARVERRQGGETLNLTRAFLYQYGTHGDTGDRGAQGTFGVDWMEGPTAGPGVTRVVRLDETWYTTLGGATGPRAQFVEDASVTRLRELSVAYTFDRPWLRRTLGLRAVDARVAGRNLHGWTDYTGFDPESGVGGALLPNRGIDWFVAPPARAWVLSVTLAR